MRGPGVSPGTTSQAIVSNIDIGATILELAGVGPAATPTDGRSFAAELLGGAAPKRDRTVIEYGRWGTGYIMRGPCADSCGMCEGKDRDMMMLVDAPSDVYSGLRIINGSHNIAYAEFARNGSASAEAASTNWTECYDLNADPWQLVNIALDPAQKGVMEQLSRELWEVAACKGGACP